MSTIGAWARLAAALAGTLLLNAALFSFLPMMSYWRQHRGQGPADRARETRLVALPMMPQKKEKPRSKEQAKPAERKSLEPGKSVARQRFVMDLGPGGGSSGGAAAEAMQKGDLEQVTYSEGETDVDAKPISQPAPKRPKQAEAAGVTGLVRVVFAVGEDGRVVDIQFLEVPGSYGFEEAVREAMGRWRYQPAIDGGVPVRQKWEQTFQF